MLFTTAVFVLLFLPITLGGFFAMRGRRGAAAWLLLASLVFYGYWMPRFTLLLVGSVCVNFAIGSRIAHAVAARGAADPAGRRWMAFGITANLVLLAYFKYFNFIVDNLTNLFDLHAGFARVALPVGISFFTFTQIAFLVDAWRGKVQEYSFIHYGLFVTYFPHLIAGPVLHHGQMMPQFAEARTYRWNGAHAAAGLAIFALGLVKKIVFADGISPYADAVFGPVDAGRMPDLAEAWLAAIAYTLQLYFDFSGYSDMAVGLSWLFNIRLPFNFDSPYRAAHISEFWRRWHISLSNFLRDYLYIPLGGNRLGKPRRYVNLMVTMLLGGLWHGASWSFVFWGGLHGIYLVVHHGYRALLDEARLERLARSTIYTTASWALTLLAVVVAWVFFRAASFSGALRMLQGMSSALPAGEVHALLWNAGLQLRTGLWLCIALAVVALWPVNSNRIGQSIMRRCQAGPSLRVVVGAASLAFVLLLVLVNTARSAASAFIYFNF
jgi:alginate O-acetyltransferase complex protein AlgI